MQASPSINNKELIAECFSSDPNYISNHWASDQGLDSCIEITNKELSECLDHQLFQVILEDGKVAAMFGIENNNILNPFFIKPKYRKKEFIGPLMKIVQSKLNKTYFMGLYSKNKPVMDFFLKNGGRVKAKGSFHDQPVTILMFENGSI